jgi:hypothetical protein
LYELLGNPTTLLIEPPGLLNFKNAVMICISPYRKTSKHFEENGLLVQTF